MLPADEVLKRMRAFRESALEIAVIDFLDYSQRRAALVDKRHVLENLALKLSDILAEYRELRRL